jgi:hypothetical protein
MEKKIAKNNIMISKGIARLLHISLLSEVNEVKKR